MDGLSYLNTASTLAGETRQRIEDPTLDDQVQDGKRYLKNSLEGLGNTFTGHAIIKGFEKSAKSKKALKALNISDEDLKAIQSQIEGGDYQGAVGKIFKGAIKKTSNELTKKINNVVQNDLPKSKADLKRIATKARRRLSVSQRQQAESGPADEDEGIASIKDAMNRITNRISTLKPPQLAEEINPLDSALDNLPSVTQLKQGLTVNDVLKLRYRGTIQQQDQLLGNLKTQGGKSFNQETSIEDRPRGAYGSAGKKPLQQPQNPNNTTQSGDKQVEENSAKNAENDVLGDSKAVVEQQAEKKGLKKGLQVATEESVEGDENPLGLIITAGLGLASLFAGLGTKDHQKKWIRPPVPINTLNYSVASGVF